jgi:hypothetical protein
MAAIPFPLPAVTFSANGRASVDLSQIPPTIDGRFVDVEGISFAVNATPTLTSGSATSDELQKMVRNINIRDAVRTHFDGSFASMRLFEMLEQGQLMSPEPDAAATTEAVNFQRFWRPGPPLFHKPEDFFLPAGALGQGAAIDISFGALTDVDAQCTALTASITPVAWLSLSDDVGLPSIYERRELALTKDVPVQGEAIYAFLGLCKTNAFPVIAAGDYSNVTLAAKGIQTRQVHVAVLERAYHDQMRAGLFTQVHGEILAATDDNPKVAAATAIAPATSVMSPLIWAGPNSKTSKLPFSAQNQLTVGWSGTQTAAYALAGRILKRTEELEAQYLQTIQQKIGQRLRPGSIDTASKKAYTGPRGRYLPVKFKVA